MSQKYDRIVEVQKFNPHHDSKGRFTSGGGAAGGGMSNAEKVAQEKYGMSMQEMRDAVANDPEAKKIASEMLNDQVSLEEKDRMTYDEVAVLAYMSAQRGRPSTTKKSYDHIEEVQKYNHNHDALGRFTSGGGIGGPMMAPDKGGGGGGGTAGAANQKYFKTGHKANVLTKLQGDIPKKQLGEMSRGFEMAEKNPQKRVRLDMGTHDVYIQRATNADTFNVSARGKNGKNDIPTSGGVKASGLGYEVMMIHRTISQNYGAPKSVKAHQQKADGRTMWGPKWIDE